MKISELLRELHVLQEQFGDLRVCIEDCDEGNLLVMQGGKSRMETVRCEKLAILSADYRSRLEDELCPKCGMRWKQHYRGQAASGCKVWQDSQ